MGQTRTHAHKYRFAGVGVWVGSETPQGYPCQSLTFLVVISLTITFLISYFLLSYMISFLVLCIIELHYYQKNGY